MLVNNPVVPEGTVPVTVNVTALFTGRSTSASIRLTPLDNPHIADPFDGAHVQVKLLNAAGKRSCTRAFSASLGPSLRTTIVNDSGPPGTYGFAEAVFSVDRSASGAAPLVTVDASLPGTRSVVSTCDRQFTRQQDQGNSAIVALGGGPRRHNSYTLDGVPIVDLINRAVFIPNLEAVEEMRVQVSTSDAEIGRTSGGVFNAPFTFGNAPRADGRVRTRMRQSWDVAFHKAQTLGRATLSVRLEIINLFNRADLGGPRTTFGDATFGQIREQIGFARTLQLLARVGW